MCTPCICHGMAGWLTPTRHGSSKPGQLEMHQWQRCSIIMQRKNWKKEFAMLQKHAKYVYSVAQTR